MKLYYSGAEVPSWRNLLAEREVENVSLSYMGLRRRVKFAKPWLIEEKFQPYQKIFLDSGGFTVNNSQADYTRDDLLDISDAYMAFVHQNVDRLEMVSEFDAHALGYDYIQAMREDFYDDLLGDAFLPIWHPEYGLDELEALASRYSRLGVLKTALNDRDLVPMLNRMVGRYGVRLHGVALTGMETMREVKWDSVASTSWLSPAQYGDTIIWVNNELKRYPKASKETARKRHRSLMTTNGFDAEAIINDDPKEVLRLSLWSWGKFVDDINRKNAFSSLASGDLVTNPTESQDSENAEQAGTEVDKPSDDARNGELVTRRETIPLPVVGVRQETITVEDESGGEKTLDTDLVEVRSESMRLCSTCVLASKCPGAKPGANCLYNIPIEVKTTQQMAALQDALIEMQFQRVTFMKMSEDLEGGYVDSNLSAEMDRLQRMIKAKREAEETGTTFTLSYREKGKSTGVISRMFGEDVGAKATAIEPIKADDLMLEAGVMDAEIVDED